MTKSKSGLNGSADLLAKAVQGIFAESRAIFANDLKEMEDRLKDELKGGLSSGLEKVRKELKGDITAQMKSYHNAMQQQISAAFDKAEKRRGATRPSA